MKLVFSNLKHYSEIDDLKKQFQGKKKGAPGSAPGLYIWGFLFDLMTLNDRTSLGSPTICNPIPTSPFDGKIFIPYYTGESTGNIFKDRLHPHMMFAKPSYPASKYVRISKTHMKDFFLEMNHMNIRGNNRVDFYLNYGKNKITYFQNREILNYLYPGITLPLKPKGTKDPLPLYAIQSLNSTIPIEDTLNNLKTKDNNLWFTYALYDYKDIDYDPKLSKLYEAYVCWSLKGVTLSKVNRLEDITGLPIKINDNVLKKKNINIFKKPPSYIFRGYL